MVFFWRQEKRENDQERCSRREVKEKGWDQTCREREREEGLDEEEVTLVPLLVYSWCITVQDYGGTKWAPDGFGKPLNPTSFGSHWEMIASEVFEVSKRPMCIDGERERNGESSDSETLSVLLMQSILPLFIPLTAPGCVFCSLRLPNSFHLLDLGLT